MPHDHAEPVQVAMLKARVCPDESRFDRRSTLLLSGLSMMLGIIQSKFTLSIVTLSGVDVVPAKFFQPVTGSHRNERTCEVVAVLKAQAERTSPL